MQAIRMELSATGERRKVATFFTYACTAPTVFYCHSLPFMKNCIRWNPRLGKLNDFDEDIYRSCGKWKTGYECRNLAFPIMTYILHIGKLGQWWPVQCPTEQLRIKHNPVWHPSTESNFPCDGVNHELGPRLGSDHNSQWNEQRDYREHRGQNCGDNCHPASNTFCLVNGCW